MVDDTSQITINAADMVDDTSQITINRGLWEERVIGACPPPHPGAPGNH